MCAFILLGMGIDELSLNSGGIPVIKKMIRAISMEKAKLNLDEIFKLETATKVRELIIERIKPLIPDLDEKWVYGQHRESVGARKITGA